MDRRPSSAADVRPRFVTFVVAHYAVVAVQFQAIPLLSAPAWLAAALTVCPVGAALVAWAVDRDGLLPAAVFAVAGAAALSDGSVGNVVRVALGRLDPSSIQPATLVTAPVALAAALVMTAMIPRRTRTRILAIALLVPTAPFRRSSGGRARRHRPFRLMRAGDEARA